MILGSFFIKQSKEIDSDRSQRLKLWFLSDFDWNWDPIFSYIFSYFWAAHFLFNIFLFTQTVLALRVPGGFSRGPLVHSAGVFTGARSRFTCVLQGFLHVRFATLQRNSRSRPLWLIKHMLFEPLCRKSLISPIWPPDAENDPKMEAVWVRSLG